MTATNYAVAPGEYLEEWINEHGLSQQRVAERLGCSRKQVNEIVNGRAPITSDTAFRLERVVGIPADSWLRYEAAYRADLARIADEENLAAGFGGHPRRWPHPLDPPGPNDRQGRRNRR
jgi:addiction module HigA family antidote